jgi:hypothetical protein
LQKQLFAIIRFNERVLRSILAAPPRGRAAERQVCIYPRTRRRLFPLCPRSRNKVVRKMQKAAPAGDALNLGEMVLEWEH